jgi:hypothetical protein
MGAPTGAQVGHCAAADNPSMKNLRPETMGIVERVESLSGRPVEFKPDSTLPLRATFQIARNGAPAHVLRYRTTNDPLDYWVASQAGTAMRLFELQPADRYDLAATGDAEYQVELLMSAGTPMDAVDSAALQPLARGTAHWALMNLRSLAVGMRVDQWLWNDCAVLKPAIAAGVDALQQENLKLLSQRLGHLSIPVNLLAPVAAYALFADRLLGQATYAIPYRAAGMLDHGRELLANWDRVPAGPDHDRELVDAWATATGMTGWYAWTPYTQ